ncbi:MAG: MFS transporter [Candidatus Dormibacteraceae bacterium]
MAAAPVVWRQRRPLVGFLGAVGISILGTRMSFLALPWFVLTTTGSATATGLVGFAQMAPYVAVQALGGPLVDRLGARRASVVTDLVAAMAVAAAPALFAAGHLPLPALAGLVAIAGAMRGAADAARNVLVPGVGELARMPIERTSGLYDGCNRGASLIGAPIAGALVALTSPLGVLGLDAGTFVVSALLVGILVPAWAQPAPPDRATRPSYVASLKAGFSYLLHDPLLLAIASMILVTNLVDQAASAVLTPVWVHQGARSSVALGLLGGAFSLGASCGNALVIWLGPRLPRRWTYAVGFFLPGAPRFLALLLLPSLPPVLIVFFLLALGAGGINPIIGAVEYDRVPRHLQARVLGAVGATAWLGIPFGSLAGGLVVSGFGLGVALAGAAVIYGIATLTPFVFPVWRQMDRASPAGSQAENP